MRQMLTMMMDVLARFGPKPDRPFVGSEQACGARRPVDDAVDQIENPEPADGAERDRRHPRQQDQETNQPFAAEIGEQRGREDIGKHHDEELGHNRNDDGVSERKPECAALDDTPEILEPNELRFAARDRRIRYAVVEREQEGKADEEDDVEDRGREHGAPQPAIIVGEARQ